MLILSESACVSSIGKLPNLHLVLARQHFMLPVYAPAAAPSNPL